MRVFATHDAIPEYIGTSLARLRSMTTACHSRFRVCAAAATACALLAQPASGAVFADPPAAAPASKDDPFAQVAPVAPTPPASAAAQRPDGKLDIEAMRHSVRDVLASEEAPSGPMGTVFGAAPAPELQRFKNRFGDAKRPWCLTAFQGAGILALVAMPLAVLLDKKDHGCKW